MAATRDRHHTPSDANKLIYYIAKAKVKPKQHFTNAELFEFANLADSPLKISTEALPHATHKVSCNS